LPDWQKLLCQYVFRFLLFGIIGDVISMHDFLRVHRR
jgi:hypothetical protein